MNWAQNYSIQHSVGYIQSSYLFHSISSILRSIHSIQYLSKISICFLVMNHGKVFKILRKSTEGFESVALEWCCRRLMAGRSRKVLYTWTTASTTTVWYVWEHFILSEQYKSDNMLIVSQLLKLVWIFSRENKDTTPCST